jgi:hypothetical protein
MEDRKLVVRVRTLAFMVIVSIVPLFWKPTYAASDMTKTWNKAELFYLLNGMSKEQVGELLGTPDSDPVDSVWIYENLLLFDENSENVACTISIMFLKEECECSERQKETVKLVSSRT